jgi:hypothetical protein
VVPVDIPNGGVVMQRLIWANAEIWMVFPLTISATIRAADEGLIEALEPFRGDKPFMATRAASHAPQSVEVDCSLYHTSTLTPCADHFRVLAPGTDSSEGVPRAPTGHHTSPKRG